MTWSVHFSVLGCCLLLEFVVLQEYFLLALDHLNQTAVEQGIALLMFLH